MPSRHARQPQAPTGVTGPIATALYVKVALNRARGRSGRHRRRWWPDTPGVGSRSPLTAPPRRRSPIGAWPLGRTACYGPNKRDLRHGRQLDRRARSGVGHGVPSPRRPHLDRRPRPRRPDDPARRLTTGPAGPAGPDGLVRRHLTEADHAPVVAAVRAWWDDGRGDALAALLPRLFFQHFGGTSLVVTDRDRLVAFLVGFVSPARPDEAYVHFVGVDPAEQGRGLGRSLYDDFAALVREHGCTTIRAVTSPANARSQAFHRRLGCTVGEPVADYDGPGQDRVTLTLMTSTLRDSAHTPSDGAVPELTHWVGGAAVAGASGRWGDVTDPATGAVTARVPLASTEEVAAAVAAARDAFPGWRDTSLARRTRVLFRFRELLDARAPDLAALITAEHGKVASDAAGEVARGQEVVEFACGMPHLLEGAATANASSGVDVHSVRRPLGVVGVVSPFNFPAMVPMWFFPIAVAAGNTVVLKPSEKVPSAALWLAELWREAGLPAGVFTVVNGDGEAVDALLTHPDVKSISFVGSTPIARHVYETGTAAGKRVQALGGAKNHMVVLPDADLDLAADQAVSAGFGSAGERCMAISVLVVVGDVADTLVARIAERARGLRIGDGRRGSDMGPLVTRAAQERVSGYVDAGEREGAAVVVDGRGVTPDADGREDGRGGFFVGPTLLDHVGTGMSVYTDEIFGPVLSVVRVDTYEQAVGVVNANPYGNGTAIFTRDGGAARRFQDDVEVGMIGVNVGVPVPMASYSFGGWKSSLFGDTHAHGTEGVHFFTRGQVVTTRWPHPSERGIELGFPRNT